MEDNKHHFDRAIMAAYTNIFKENALYALLEYVKNRSYGKTAPQVMNVLKSMIDGLKKLNLYSQAQSHSYSECVMNIKAAIEDAMETKEKIEITTDVMLDIYNTTNGQQVSIFLLEKIDEYTNELCQQDGAMISEVYSDIINTFKEVNPDDDLFMIPLAQPSDITEIYKEQTQSCVKYLLKLAQSKVCLKLLFYQFMILALY
jgi:hypothetical protein